MNVQGEMRSSRDFQAKLAALSEGTGILTFLLCEKSAQG